MQDTQNKERKKEKITEKKKKKRKITKKENNKKGNLVLKCSVSIY